MRYVIEKESSRTVICLQGDLDLVSHAGLEQVLEKVAEGGSGPVVLDLAEVPYIDSTGALILMGFESALRRQGRVLLIQGATYRVRRLCRLLDLEWLLEPDAPGPAPERLLQA